MRIARAASLRLIVVSASAFACSGRSNAVVPLDPSGIALSFVVIGCNRVTPRDTAGNVSTANRAQLDRTLADIAAFPVQPNFLFFNGDEVLGYANDSTVVDKELKGWTALYRASPLAGSTVELVAIPGNHELQNATRMTTAAGERVWLRDMAAYITRGGNGPGAGGADALASDQSKLTYSFDFKDTHFVIMNTDPLGAESHVPVKWIAADLAAARAKGVTHIFAIGHKPSYPYPTVPTDGLSFDVASRDALWKSLTANRVEATFAAHNHVFYRTQPTGNTWMIIAGNGGTALDATVDATIPGTGVYFGFTLVTVTNEGRVIARSYGRDVPAAGYSAAANATQYPTTLRDSVEVTWK